MKCNERDNRMTIPGRVFYWEGYNCTIADPGCGRLCPERESCARLQKNDWKRPRRTNNCAAAHHSECNPNLKWTNKRTFTNSRIPSVGWFVSLHFPPIRPGDIRYKGKSNPTYVHRVTLVWAGLRMPTRFRVVWFFLVQLCVWINLGTELIHKDYLIRDR